LPLVTAELTLTELRGIEARSLDAALGDRLSVALRSRLQREAASFLSIEKLGDMGILAAYDPANLTIALSLAREAMGPQTFTFASDFNFGAAERARPAGFALGVTGNLIGSRDLSAGSDSQQLLYNFAGFANFGGRDGIYLSYGGTFNLAGASRPLFERDRLIAFMDFEKSVLRVSAGDLAASLPLIVGQADIIGLSLERRYDALQPLRNIRPTGRRQFTVERPSRIEIYANGALVQALDVNAGPVDLNQIPALSLSSNISIIVEDATGRREIDSFTLANDIELLAAGISEFSFSAGLIRKPSLGSGLIYSGTPIVSGQYARGFNDMMTVGGHFAAMSDYQNVGATFAGLAPGGAVFLGASVSNDQLSNERGYAFSLAYRGDPLRLSELDSQLNLRIDYRSQGYRTLSQVLEREPVKIDIALDYRINLTTRLAMSLGGNYLERHANRENTWAGFVGAQIAVGRVIASATARYARFGDRIDKGVLATLTVPLGRRHFSTASYDSATGQSRFEARRVRDITVPEFDYGMIAERGPLMDRVTGQGRFANSRFNLDVELIATRPDFSMGARDQNIVNFRLQSGFAVVDGVFGIGRNPARGFVMVDRHRSLRGARVDVENSGVGRRAGQSNAFGPAVIGQLSPYRPDNIRLSVQGGPAGYDIGAGEYISDPGALSGVRIKVGNDAFRTALVTFVTPDGAVVKLAEGVVRNLATGETSGVFTNSAGRAVLSQLAEGNYRVELMGGDMTFDFQVDKSAPVIMRLGTQTVEVVP
jgi:outer membrane usher protein